MKAIVAILALLLLAAATPPPVANGPLRQCQGPDGPCREISWFALRIAGREIHIERRVTVAPEALPLSRPLMVWVNALASSEVRWNGVPIGRNGQPGASRASERPGRYVASIPVPIALVRPGENVVSLRLSAHHLPLPVRHALHRFDVTPYETPSLGLIDYLPALLTIGALAAAFVYFAAAAALDRSSRDAWLIAAIAGFAILQLVVEVVRGFVAYAYPWHVARVSAIALLAAMTAVFAAAYAARRFAPKWRRKAPALSGAAAAAALVLISSFDLKAMAAILAGLLALAGCAAVGLRGGRQGAVAVLAGSLLLIGLMAWQLTTFLDRTYYFGVAAFLVLLVAEQVAILRGERRRHDTEAQRAAALQARLRQASEVGEAIVELRNGGRIDRVAEGDILYVRAADDYCDVILADGRTLLVTANLAKLLTGLSDHFVRVHKSYAVNRRHVSRVAPKAGGGRQLLLGEGATIPVGRRYAEAVAGLNAGA
ncbi:LytTR family DNA-binding domain-containing protein [Sphingosinicella sp. CPCC 101087]|uniref:LytTR family DNA-binding domain-containing protein n=1 Tax=Sphingosinicella sp. CPCC 101087 TaxID=2497754 RepID=UPI00101D5F49|nr:LytTR family DNA-binding domain-containing protein [Sphingosinicella sp. CPCC 101087]